MSTVHYWQIIVLLQLIAIALILTFWLRGGSSVSLESSREKPFLSQPLNDNTDRLIPLGKSLGRSEWFPDTTENPFVEQIDMVYFINLDSRSDRKESVLAELRRLGVPDSRITRIPGVVHKYGALGCTKSHINALRDAMTRGLRNCVILEDDFVLKPSGPRVLDVLGRFFRCSIRWDVVMLSAFVRESTATSFDFLARTTNAQTTAGYMVNRCFFATLLANFEESERGFVPKVAEFCIDQHWKTLQHTAHWYVFRPVIGYQADGYSDIEKRDVAYYDKVELPLKTKSYRHVILSKTCKARLDRIAAQQTAVREAEASGLDVCIYHFFGDPALDREFEIDEQSHVVTLRCADDYMNLCHKFGLMLRFADVLMRNNRSFDTVNGFMTTDEDIEIVSPDFYATMERHAIDPYWGYKTTCTVDRSWHFKVKYDESALVKTTIDSRYPSLIKIPVELLPLSYVAGGAAYVRSEYISELSRMNDLFSPFPSTDFELMEYYNKEKRMFVGLPAFQDHNCGVGMRRLGVTPVMVDDVQKYFHWE